MSDQPTAPEGGDNKGADADDDFELTEASGLSGATIAVAIEPSEPLSTPARSTIPPEKAVELLSKISLFAALQPSYLRRIANLGIEEDYESGAMIFKEGT